MYKTNVNYPRLKSQACWATGVACCGGLVEQTMFVVKANHVNLVKIVLYASPVQSAITYFLNMALWECS